MIILRFISRERPHRRTDKLSPQNYKSPAIARGLNLVTVRTRGKIIQVCGVLHYYMASFYYVLAILKKCSNCARLHSKYAVLINYNHRLFWWCDFNIFLTCVRNNPSCIPPCIPCILYVFFVFSMYSLYSLCILCILNVFLMYSCIPMNSYVFFCSCILSYTILGSEVPLAYTFFNL